VEMNNRKIILTIANAIILCHFAYGQVTHNDLFNFDITLPEGCVVEYNDNGLQPYMVASDGKSLISLSVFKAKDKMVYSYRKNIKNNPIFDSAHCYTIQAPTPWYNLLRHKRTMTERYEDEGVLVFNLVEFRAKTLFYLYISCDKDSIVSAQSILDSFSSNCTTYNYLKILTSNLRWYQGSFYLSILPALGLYTSSKRKKWLRSGKHDIRAKKQSIASVVLSLIVLGGMFFCLKDCLSLAFIIGLISIAIWLVFFWGQKFLMNFINGFFGV
jgi:hypothetical protein